MCNSKDNGSGISFLVGVAVGAFIGAATALLVAPKTGSETREDLKDVSADLKVKANSFVQVVSDKSKELMECAKDKIGQVTANMKKSEVEETPAADDEE